MPGEFFLFPSKKEDEEETKTTCSPLLLFLPLLLPSLLCSSISEGDRDALASVTGRGRRGRNSLVLFYSFFFFFFVSTSTAALTFLLHKSFSPLSLYRSYCLPLSRLYSSRGCQSFGRASFFLFFSSSSFLVASLFSQHPSHRRRVATSPAVVGREPHTRGNPSKPR